MNKKQRSALESEYVNQYRRAWGSNAGLDAGKIQRFTDRQLKQNVRSLKEFADRSGH